MVKNILIIRHCEASHESPSKRDFDRPLTAHGKKQAELLGQYLYGLSLPMEAIYLSPAKRTVETTSIFLKQLDQQPRIMDAEELYEATENVLKAAVNRFDPNFDTVALVGHNPSVSALCTYLTGEIHSFNPGDCVWVQIETADWYVLSHSIGTAKDYFSSL